MPEDWEGRGRNGTFINDTRLISATERLGFGDVIRFGYDTASFRLERAEGVGRGPEAGGVPGGPAARNGMARAIVAVRGLALHELFIDTIGPWFHCRPV
jgi:hypothetical protein